MSETRSPRETFHALLDGITAGRFAELAVLYAEDAVVETVFEPGGPGRYEGRKVLAERFAQLGEALPLELSPRNVLVRGTDDPEVIVAEWDYQVRHRATGRTRSAANIMVLRVRDGLVVHSRDFHDHLGLAVLTGGLPELVAALEAK
ncbi:nuclear transport factor 2 family protein [Kitasatospora sp. NPDC094019]|uniref:nuclear transport factor 2 family protein n=1 Tax=Kitasatospora sp. NPDC094019 TaxID=3364091 RepID=UPI00380529B0